MFQNMNNLRQMFKDEIGEFTVLFKNSSYDFTELYIDQIKYPNIYQIKDELAECANMYYENWEIVGKTEWDFWNNIKTRFSQNAGTLEKYLEAYEQIVPAVRTLREVTDTLKDNILSKGQTDAMPLNADDGEPTMTEKSESDRDQIYTRKEWDNGMERGVQPLMNRMDDFINRHTTPINMFINFFKDCFIIQDVII